MRKCVNSAYYATLIPPCLTGQSTQWSTCFFGRPAVFSCCTGRPSLQCWLAYGGKALQVDLLACHLNEFDELCGWIGSLQMVLASWTFLLARPCWWSPRLRPFYHIKLSKQSMNLLLGLAYISVQLNAASSTAFWCSFWWPTWLKSPMARLPTTSTGLHK